MKQDEALSNAVSLAITVTQDGEVVSFDREVFKDALRRFGFAIVPAEPTKRMLSASGGLWGDADANIYRAMIAAYEKEQGDG